MTIEKFEEITERTKKSSECLTNFFVNPGNITYSQTVELINCLTSALNDIAILCKDYTGVESISDSDNDNTDKKGVT